MGLLSKVSESDGMSKFFRTALLEGLNSLPAKHCLYSASYLPSFYRRQTHLVKEQAIEKGGGGGDGGRRRRRWRKKEEDANLS